MRASAEAAPEAVPEVAGGHDAAGSAALVVDNVSRTFAGTIVALDGISFSVAPGEFVSIIGPSGCGKSTLFSIVGGLDAGFGGRVLVRGAPIDGPHPAIGMVFQEQSTFPWRSVLENVAFPLEMRGVGKAERRERARRFIALVGLRGFEDRYPDELSGGMRQRVAIARTLAMEPEILLMDEPFGALDEQTRLLLGEKVLHIQQTLAQTTLLITHSIGEAVQLSDRIVVMTYRPGRVKRIIRVPLARPRDHAALTSEAFGRTVAEVWNDLRDEATSGMAETEQLPHTGAS